MVVICLKLSFWRRLKESPPRYFWSRRLRILFLRCIFSLLLGKIMPENYFFFLWPFDPISGHGLPYGALRSYSLGTRTIGRTSLDKLLTRRRSLYLTTHNTHKRKITMPPLDSNPQSQKANGRRHTPYTIRPQASAGENYS
jgi:hypothetical protein